MSDKKLPRYSIIGPPFMSLYAITDDWQATSHTAQVLEKRYGSRSSAEKDCHLLNRAQTILSADN